MSKNLQLLFLFTILFSLISVSVTKAQTDWEFDASVYMWFAGIDGTVGLANAEQQIDATPSDLLSNLEFALPLHFEIRNQEVSIIADVLYMGLGQTVDVQVTTPHNTFANTAEMDMDQWVVEGAFGFRVSEVFEILLALRYYDLSVSMVIDDAAPSKTENWYDGFIGARYKTDFAKDWYTAIRADIGMGGSDFAWYGDATVGYRFSQLFSLTFNYRVISLDYETGSGIDYFKYDTFNHGFGLGAVFTF